MVTSSIQICLHPRAVSVLGNSSRAWGSGDGMCLGKTKKCIRFFVQWRLILVHNWESSVCPVTVSGVYRW